MKCNYLSMFEDHMPLTEDLPTKQNASELCPSKVMERAVRSGKTYKLNEQEPSVNILIAERYPKLLNIPLQWRHNGRGGVSDHQRHDCLLNR